MECIALIDDFVFGAISLGEFVPRRRCDEEDFFYGMWEGRDLYILHLKGSRGSKYAKCYLDHRSEHTDTLYLRRRIKQTKLI